MARVTCMDCGRKTEPQYFSQYVGGMWNPRVGAFDGQTLAEVQVDRCDRCQARRDAAEARSEQLYASSYGLGL